jgi:plastocyanin
MDGAKNITAIFAPIIHGPARVNASDGTFASHVLVDWSPIANATGYNVYRNTTENNCDMATRIATTNRIMRYEDRTALPGVTYWYWVTALTSQGESDRCPSPNDAGFRAANWQSEAVNWRVDYDNNWIRGATVTKPGATNIRVHLSAISMGAGDHLRTTTQDDWTGYSTDVTSKATVDKNSIGIVLVSDASGTGYFVIDRVEFQGTSAGPATWAGELAQGVVTPTRTPTWTPTPWIPPTPTATFTLPVPPLPPTFTPTVPPSGQLQPTRTPTVKPGATVPSTTIVMANKTFTPANLRIARGTQVMWLNTDKTATYKIVSGTSLRRTTLFASGALPPGAVFKFTFTTPGIYTYFDETLGAQMQGTITVQ